MKHTLIFLLAVVLLSVQSCTIEKRHYRSGYYLNGLLTREKATEPQTGPGTEKEEISEPVAAGASVVVVNESAVLVAVPEKTPDAEQTKIAPQFTTVTHEANEVSRESVTPAPAPKIEPDKKQAIGAGVAAAIFFLLGMTGLIIQGTTGPAGIFIGAAFICFLLCVILASFLYPKEAKEPKVEKPKEPEPKGDRIALKIGITLLIASLVGVLAFAALILGIFFNSFW